VRIVKTLWTLFGTALLGFCVARADQRLVIHEWGTMTTLEDEDGEAIAGINADDEPVPSFVHEVAPRLLLGPGDTGKGVPGVHPDVTVRLETPVLYIHAPPEFKGPLDVSVKFVTGWLTEFYPNAEAHAPGIDPATGHVGRITGPGTLHWAHLRIGGSAPGPATSERVWLSPRDVTADTVTTQGGESEKFLFYRGVGRGEPLLHFIQDPESQTVKEQKSATLLPFWLADIRPDGSVAFQYVSDPLAGSRPFSPDENNPLNIATLRQDLQSHLIAAGLYRDEAQALLNTWEVSYFKNPGLRAFYVWPRDEVDRVLPLTISPAADVTRVMVGRTELMTPRQRATIQRIGNLGDPNQAGWGEAVKLYTGLGRFREALVLNENQRHPTQGLEDFMQRMSVAYYRP